MLNLECFIVGRVNREGREAHSKGKIPWGITFWLRISNSEKERTAQVQNAAVPQRSLKYSGASRK